MNHVKRHHVPQWLYRRLQKTTNLAKNRHGAELLQDDKDLSIFWLDHWGTDGDKFISEPYNLPDISAEQMKSFADRHGLHWLLSGGAAWHKDTFRITFWPKPKD